LIVPADTPKGTVTPGGYGSQTATFTSDADGTVVFKISLDGAANQEVTVNATHTTLTDADEITVTFTAD